MPIYFTGQTGPALPLNSVQYNSGPGQLAGDANLTWVPASGLTGKKHAAIGGSSAIDGGLLWGASKIVLDVEEIFTVDNSPDGFASGHVVVAAFDYPADSSTFNSAAFYVAQIRSGNSRNYDYLNGFESAVEHLGTGILGSGYGVIGFVANRSTGVITGAYPFRAYVPVNPLGTIVTDYGYFADDRDGAPVTNPYYSWFDSRGVLRVKEDNTFNSVGQAIQALYNPQFTKYTPGAANHERIVLGQWSSNVAQIGTEKGGTGTLQAMDFIGASVGFPLSATNGQNFVIKILTELTTIAAAATTDTAIQIPANAVVFGVDVRVTVAIPTAATFTVIGAGSATVFNTVAVTVAADSTDKGTKSCPFYNATAQAIRITPDIQPGANTGRLRVTIHYYEIVAATS